MSEIILSLIICSVCCMLIGGIIAFTHAVKLARDKRILERELQSYLQTRKAESRMTKEDAPTESKSMAHKEGMIT